MKRIFYGLIIVFSFSLQSCGEMEIPDPNPGGFDGVDFKITITQNPYTALQNVGGSAIIKEHKVIVARLTNSNWFAYQSYCPSDSNVELVFKFGGINAPEQSTFTCPKDNAVYDYTGKGSSGNLKPYATTFSVDSGVLRVYEL